MRQFRLIGAVVAPRAPASAQPRQGVSADRLERTIPGAQKVITHKCGHMPQPERADEFNRILGDFLRGGAASHQ